MDKNINEIYERLEKDQPTFEEVDDEWTANGLNSTPFKALVSVSLSTMTYSSRVIKACVPLYEKADTPEAILKLDKEELRETIKSVAHYNRKTENLRKMCQQLIDDFDGKVPTNRKDLLSLTGVGQKCVDIMMNFEFNEDSIAVDTHVFRVLNRIGIIDTKSHEKASKIINELTPKKYKKHAHERLIGLGMRVCHARKPNCSNCALTDLCDYYQTHVLQGSK